MYNFIFFIREGCLMCFKSIYFVFVLLHLTLIVLTLKSKITRFYLVIWEHN